MAQRTLLDSKIIMNICPKNFKFLSNFERKQFCSASKSGHTRGPEVELSFREKMIRKHFEPSETDVKRLKEKFPDPKKVIDDLFAPFKQTEEYLIPKMERKKQLGDSICKTTLMFRWPATVDVGGKHNDEDTSVLNAYLNACQLFMHMGLLRLSEEGTAVYSPDIVIKMLEELATYQSGIMGYESNNFQVINLLQHDQDEHVTWDSSVQVFWPMCFTVNSKSPSLDLAYYQSCLKTVMKLKASGYLDNHNEFKKGILLSLSRLELNNDNTAFGVKNVSDPDFEIFVDASKYGMGAYLISREDENIRWFSEHWVNTDKRMDSIVNTFITELYAMVTAFYTWKHKFVGKKVLCYCDNNSVINAINHGFYFTKAVKRDEFSLFRLLMKICHNYKISVVGLHVPRDNNVAADCLSRCDVESFKKIMPMAYKKPKKLKKLCFCKIVKNSDKDKNYKGPNIPS